jgi:hypothetical protein
MKRRILAAVVAALALSVAGACSSDESSDADARSTTTAAAEPRPPLPADIDTAYAVGELVALGDVKLQVRAVDDPYEQAGDAPDGRYVALEAEVRNGSPSSMTVHPRSFRLYNTDGSSSTPVPGGEPRFGGALASGEAMRGRMVFEVGGDEQPAALVFDAGKYGPKVHSALVVLDEDYRPANADG